MNDNRCPLADDENATCDCQDCLTAALDRSRRGTGRTREMEALLWGVSPTDYHSETQPQPPVWAA